MNRSENNTIIGNNASKSILYSGISLQSSCNNTISANTLLSNNHNGIWLGNSNNNIIAKNNASCSVTYSGISLGNSNNNIIDSNNALNNSHTGILIENSTKNEISNSILTKNRQSGVWLKFSSQNIVANNTLTNMNWSGIEVYYSNKNEITKNEIMLCNHSGIFVFDSHDNLILKNTVKDISWCSIDIHGSNDNEIYLNNFINTCNVNSENSTNIWNSTHQITYSYNGSTYTNYLGNYRSDYTGSDADEDGIGDTPYSIDSDKDNYPLMEPWEIYFAPTENIFDTGRPENPHPSISGKFIGTIRTNTTVIATKLYTYPCEGEDTLNMRLYAIRHGVRRRNGMVTKETG